MRSHDRPFLPRTFWRFFLPTLCVVAAAFVAATVVTYFTGISAFTNLHAKNANGLLASASTGYRHALSDINEFRRLRFSMEQDKVRDQLAHAMDVCALYHALAQNGQLAEEDAKRLALARIATPTKDQTAPVLLVAKASEDDGFTLLSASRPTTPAPSALLATLRSLVQASRQDEDAAPAFLFATSFFNERTSMSPYLATARAFQPWGWLVAGGLSMDAYKFAVAEKERTTMRDFTAYLTEIAAGTDGELVVFGEQCEMAAASSQDPGRHRLGEGAWMARCRAMIAAATDDGSPQSPAQGRLAQGAGADRGEVFWSVRVPEENLYAAFVIPASLLAVSAVKFVDMLTITGLSAIVVLGLALTFLLAGLLRPVSILTDAYRRVMSGDFTVRADEDVPGELGDLCRQFNAMTRSLQELMQTEQLRQVELDEINRSLENKVRLRTEALVTKARELEEANRRLQEMDHLKTNFLQNVSHELRTPLTAVLGFAKLIHKDFLKHFAQLSGDNVLLQERGERILRNLDIIISEGERLTRLINDVLDLAKIESGRMTWNDEFLDPAAMLRGVADTFRSRAAESGVALILDLPEELPGLMADRDRLTQVMVNLLDNAFKFTATGEVRISARQENEAVAVAVADTGTGIEAEELERIFDKFHQTSRRDTLKDKPSGTGLGLAICRQIAQHYGGGIAASSRPGEGTTFTLTLPARRAGVYAPRG